MSLVARQKSAKKHMQSEGLLANCSVPKDQHCKCWLSPETDGKKPRFYQILLANVWFAGLHTLSIFI